MKTFSKIIFLFSFIIAFNFSITNIFGQTYASTNNTNAKIKNLEYKYIVTEGDYLLSISKRYGVKIQEIRTWNNLTSDALHLGQELTIFAKHIEEDYTVKANENLQDIASFYGVTPNKILEWNNLKNSSDITAGQNLKIYILKKNADK